MARVADVLVRRSLLPFVDMAYQGLGEDLERDVAGLRILAERVPEMLLAISCSKNFGLYRERVGALTVLSRSPAAAAAVSSHQARIARRMYSMPPDHGAAIAAHVLGDEKLRERGSGGRRDGRAHEGCGTCWPGGSPSGCPTTTSAGSRRQRGMFSLLGLADGQLHALREQHHIYMPPDGRMNVAGISELNVDYIADAVASLTK